MVKGIMLIWRQKQKTAAAAPDVLGSITTNDVVKKNTILSETIKTNSK